MMVGAQWWIDELPSLVAAIEAEWAILVGRPYRDSTEALVTQATCADGTPAVLKMIVPRDGMQRRVRRPSCGLQPVTGVPGCYGRTFRAERCCSNGSAARCMSCGCPLRTDMKFS